MKRTTIILTILILFSACKKNNSTEEETLPYSWIKQGNTLTYNYYSDNDTTLNAMTLSIIINPGMSNLRVDFEYPQWTGVPISKWVGEDFNVFRRKDGIYESTHMSCINGASIFLYYFLRVPSQPILYNYYPVYLCKDSILTCFKVEETNKIINVPLGQFNTFVIQDTMTLTKEFWSETNGIIKFELYDSSGTLTGQYQLVGKNY